MPRPVQLAIEPTHFAHRILVVDDLPESAKMLGLASERVRGGAEVVVAPGGASATQLILEERFHAIVADYRMPGVDGLRVLAHARQFQPEARRLLVTAYDLEDLPPAAWAEAAPDAFLKKPVKLADLVKALS